MRHVLVLNQFAVPRSAAGGTRHVELFGRLEGWTAKIYAGRTTLSGERIGSDDLITAIPVTPYKGNGLDRIFNWISYSALALIRGLFSRPRPDVVYGSSPHLGAALAAWMISVVRRSKFVLEVRDLWPQILVEAGTMTEQAVVYRLLKRLETFLYRRASVIVVLAEGSRTAIEGLGIPGDRIVFVPNGADPEDFEVSEDRSELRQRYGFHRFTAVYTGAHGPANGLDLLLDAVEDASAAGADLDVVLFGDGVQKEALRRDAAERGIENVRFEDPVPKGEIPLILAAADVGLHVLADVPLFRSGVSPNKLFDYMAAGLPVLTNTGGDVADMVNAAQAGVTVAPGQLCVGLVRLADRSGDGLREVGCNGIEWMRRMRSRTALALRLRSVLDDAAGERS